MLGELVPYWNEHPPLHSLMKAFVGYQPSILEDKESLQEGIKDAVYQTATLPGVKIKTWDQLPAGIQKALLSKNN